MKKIFVGQKEKFNFEREYGKIYYAVNKESAFIHLAPKKVSKTASAAEDFWGVVFSANSCRSQCEPRPKTVKAPVSRCKTVCTHPVDWVASVYLREAETQCRGLCRPLSQGTVLPLATSWATRKKYRDAG